MQYHRFLSIVFVLGSVGAGAGESVADSAACPGACEIAVGYTVDAAFDGDERRIIEEGARVWQADTGGRVCFTKDGGGDLVFLRLEQQSQMEPYDPDWRKHVALNKGGRIWIVAPEIEDAGEYRALVIHEIGHFLGLGHIEDTPATYMHTTINDTPRPMWKHARLPDRDRRAFCAVHRCVCQW